MIDDTDTGLTLELLKCEEEILKNQGKDPMDFIKRNGTIDNLLAWKLKLNKLEVNDVVVYYDERVGYQAEVKEKGDFIIREVGQIHLEKYLNAVKDANGTRQKIASYFVLGASNLIDRFVPTWVLSNLSIPNAANDLRTWNNRYEKKLNDTYPIAMQGEILNQVPAIGIEAAKYIQVHANSEVQKLVRDV
jgi:hypothetical protein